MCEFKSNLNYFRQTCHRVIAEICFLLLTFIIFWYVLSKGTLEGFEVIVLAIIAVYISIGLAYYSKGKAMAENFSICFLDDALGFSDQEKTRKIPYRDLSISKVTKKNGQIVKVFLKPAFGQTIKLKGFENMNELYDLLKKRIKI